jgi:hypothetical protein
VLDKALLKPLDIDDNTTLEITTDGTSLFVTPVRELMSDSTDFEAYLLADVDAGPWYESRPESVQHRIREYPPFYLYRDAKGRRVFILAYSENEDDTCTCCVIRVLRRLNPDSVLMDRDVFDVPFEELTRICLLKDVGLLESEIQLPEGASL